MNICLLSISEGGQTFIKYFFFVILVETNETVISACLDLCGTLFCKK